MILFHGDLGTFEHVLSILQQHALESTVHRRYQFIVFLMGLFHLKMACADAIWRIFIEPKAGRMDANSLLLFVAQYRPRQTGKIGSDPGFRIMHEVIGNTGVALRLDTWHVEAHKRNSEWVSLETFAAAQPSLDLIEEMANSLAVNYVAGYETNIFKLRGQATASRDTQHENMLIMHQYFLLYEEITFAMNHGDIGRLETLFPPWIYIFKATGKHKYAAQMTKFLTDVHFVYPEGLRCICTLWYLYSHSQQCILRRAVRYNIMVNPTGKEGAFRGADWVEESNNLFIKVRNYVPILIGN